MSTDALIEDLAGLTNDPLGFVTWAFPWGEPGTELEKSAGPELWQVSLLSRVRDGLLSPDEAIREATASGHGIGKSALVAWIILWSISTLPDTRGVVTANTETQLKTKTWAELGKWYRLFIAKEFFVLTATAIYNRQREREWRIDMIPWSERSTEAFAGLHNQGKRIVVIFDEASAIPDVIWETTEGALTDQGTQIMWLVFGNPTRNTGRFKECFGRNRHVWHTTQVDSREVSFTNKKQIKRWIDHYGEDSDFVRVRVRGIFPRVGSLQFISSAVAEDAAARDLPDSQTHDPLVIGVDVARYGDNSSVIYIRKGRDGRSYPPLEYRGLDTMNLAGRVVEQYLALRADAVFVDGGGLGGGVVDRLRQLRVPVIDVIFNSKPSKTGLEGDETKYANKRAEMWGAMREWLKGGAIPDDNALVNQLTSPTYGFNGRDEIQLERKEDMMRRGAESPDIADALALTFAFPVVPSEMAGGPHRQGKDLVERDYDPFGEKELAA